MSEPNSGEIIFKPSSAIFDENDERWQGQVQALLENLRSAGGQIKRGGQPVAGTKGAGLTEIVLALGSSGAISMAVVAFKAWLARDKNRVVTFTEKRDGKVVREIRITAENASEDVIMQTLQKAA